MNPYRFSLLILSVVLISYISTNISIDLSKISAIGQEQQHEQPILPPLPSIQEEQKQKQQQFSSWTTAANMTTQRSEVTGAVLNGKIYVIGGINATGKSIDTVEVYDPGTDKWRNVSSLPERRDHAAAAADNGKLYVAGGYTDWKPSDKLFIYDLSTNKWQEGKPMPTARGALTSEFINGTLYAIGGNSTQPLNTTEAYNPQNNSWTAKAPMPTAKHHIASAISDGKVYVFGGRQLDNSTSSFVISLNKTEMYDPLKNTWTVLEPMPSKRGGLASAASTNGSIYVFGGEIPPGSNETITVFYNNEKYDTKDNKWTSEPPMLTARHGFVAETIDNKTYIIGGGMKPGLSVSNLNEVFHINKIK